MQLPEQQPCPYGQASPKNPQHESPSQLPLQHWSAMLHVQSEPAAMHDPARPPVLRAPPLFEPATEAPPEVNAPPAVPLPPALLTTPPRPPFVPPFSADRAAPEGLV